MAHVPFLVFLNVCRFPSHRNRPGTTGRCHRHWRMLLSGRDAAIGGGLPAGKAGTLRIGEMETAMNGAGGRASSYPRRRRFFRMSGPCSAHTACSVL